MRIATGSSLSGLRGIPATRVLPLPAAPEAPPLEADLARADGSANKNTDAIANPGVDTIATCASNRVNSSSAADVTIARPLLRVSKARLVATCSENGLGYVSDPSNTDVKYQRNAVRAALSNVYDRYSQRNGRLGQTLPTFECNVQHLVARLGEAAALADAAVECAARTAVRYIYPSCAQGRQAVGVEVDLGLLFASTKPSVQAALISKLTGELGTTTRVGTRLKQVEQVLRSLRSMATGRIAADAGSGGRVGSAAAPKPMPPSPGPGRTKATASRTATHTVLMKGVCVGGCILRCTSSTISAGGHAELAGRIVLTIEPQPRRRRKQSR